MLNEEQIRQFHTLGFLHLPGFIPEEHMRTYVEAFNDTMTSANGGTPWDRAPKR